MTDKEKAIVMAHTGICMLTGDKFQIFHKYVEDIMNRPIMTHELGWLEDEIKEKSKADFMALCANESNSEIPKNSPTETLISLDVYNQVAKERDIAIEQLHELGYEFGQKIEPTNKNDLGVDCIDRQAAITFVCKNTEEILKDTMPLEVKLSDDYLYENVAKIMRNPKVLTSVTPIRPKGHWITETPRDKRHLGSRNGYCSVCKDFYTDDWDIMNYCPNCGSDNREVEE